MNPLAALLAWLRSLLDPPLPPADGRFIVYERLGKIENIDGSAIGVARMDGTGRQLITTPGKHRDWSPRPSPDGQTVLFNRDPIGHKGSLTSQLWAVNRDGTNERPIMGLDGFTAMGHHEWTPDGQRLFFSASGPTRTFAIWRCEADGSKIHQITDGETMAIDPSVCPDGTILYAGRTTGTIADVSSSVQEIWHMQPDGIGAERLTWDSRLDARGEYDIFASPDNERMVYLRDTSDWGLSAWDNFIADIDGSSPIRIANGQADGTSYGVARWVDDTTIVTTRRGRWGFEIVSIDVDLPAVKTVVLASTPSEKFRNPARLPG